MSSGMLYTFSSIGISALLFLAIIISNELCYHLGRFIQNKTTAELRTLTGSLQASILGLLALLIGFTFSMSLQRFDSRTTALIDEVNTIGTAQLRAQLIDEKFRDNIDSLLNEYVELRISMSEIDLTNASLTWIDLDEA